MATRLNLQPLLKKMLMDDQADIERRVIATMERQYHCMYCHSLWHEGKNGHCISCGSGKKVCNSCNDRSMLLHGTIDGGDR